MAFTIERLIFGILVIFQYYGVNSEKLIFTPGENIPVINNHQIPLRSAGYMVQQVTYSIDNIGQIFYNANASNLLCANRKHKGTINIWSQKKSEVGSYYLKELRHDIITSMVPVKDNSISYIIGTNLTLRFITKNQTDYSLTKPVITFDEPGFMIHSAHCDANGVMFVLLVGKYINNKNLGKLYKIEKKQAQFVKQFTTTPGDFRFNFDNTAIYMVNDHGKKITYFQYDKTTRKLGDATDVFDINDHPRFKHYLLTSVVPDRNPGHIWVAAAGGEGCVVEINPKNKTIVSMTSVPAKDLTFLTFGLGEYKHLFVGSKNSCTKGYGQGAVYCMTGMNKIGVMDESVAW